MNFFEAIEMARRPCCGEPSRTELACNLQDGKRAGSVDLEEALHLLVHESLVDGSPHDGVYFMGLALGHDHPMVVVATKYAVRSLRGLAPPTPEEWAEFIAAFGVG